MANTRYENFIIENKLKSQLETALNMLDYVTVDDTLTEGAGMTKKVNVYTATGAAQDVTEGAGNTESIEMSYDQRSYTVGTTQARFVYTDEDQMADPFLVDSGAQKLSEAMINALNEKVDDEYWKATNYKGYTKGTDSVNFDLFVDALALLNKEKDEEAGLFALCSPAMKAVIRKGLKDELKYVESFTRTGYIGTVCGVPIYISKLIPDDCVIIASRSAVKYYRKKAVEVEQDRDRNLRKSIIYARQVGVVAFVDAGECAIIAPNPTAPTITTSSLAAGSGKEITGACASGARVEVLRGGAKIGEATVSGATWSYTIDTVTAADAYTVRQYVKGFAVSTSTALTAS